MYLYLKVHQLQGMIKAQQLASSQEQYNSGVTKSDW